MLLHCGLLLLFLNCVITNTETVYDYGMKNVVTELDRRFSYWPSIHNAAQVMRLRKREAKDAMKHVGQSEGGEVGDSNQLPVKPELQPHQQQQASDVNTQQGKEPSPPPDVISEKKEEKNPDTPIVPGPVTPTTNETAVIVNPVSSNNETHSNATTPIKTTATQLDLNNPGVLKRGVIVFGGFLLLAVAYFIFYRRKSTKNDTSSTHNAIDTNQFRYGVLQSEDRRDNLELSRIPLTMESDDEEDDDLEIFDLEQKKKSLSYVNLQTNDEDIVFNTSGHSRDDDKDNLLLDIEDPATDTLINWSNNGSKSIL